MESNASILYDQREVLHGEREKKNGHNPLLDLTYALTTFGKCKPGVEQMDVLHEKAFHYLVEQGGLYRDAETAEPYLRRGRMLVKLDKESVQAKIAIAEWFKVNPASSTFNLILEDLRLRTIDRAPRILLSHYQEYRDNKLYISCGPEHLVRAHTNGLEKLPNGSDGVWFAEDSTYPEWTPEEPVDPLSLSPFRPSLQTPAEAPRYTTEGQQRLVVAWMIARLSGIDQLPLLVVRGGRGSGKTELAKAILRTFDPADTVQEAPNDRRDFAAKLVHSSVIGLDNLDEDVHGWMKDMLAAAATGMKLSQRRLYSNYDLATAIPRAGVLITSRTAAWARADVAERSIVLNVTSMQCRREADETLKEAVVENRNRLMTYLALHAWRARHLMNEAPDLPGRFVSFARLVWAYGRVIGWDAAPVLRAAIIMQSLTAADSDEMVSALLEHWADISSDNGWSGTPTELVNALEEAGAKLPHYGGGKAIATVLRELKPILRTVGFELGERKQGSNTVFSLSYQEDTEGDAATLKREQNAEEKTPEGEPRRPINDSNCSKHSEESGETGEKNHFSADNTRTYVAEKIENSPDSPALKENDAIQQYQELLSSSVSHLRSEEHAERSLVHSCHYKEGGERMDAQTDEQMDALREWLLSEFAGRRVSWKEIQSHALQSFSRFPVTRDLLIQAVRQLMDSAQVSRTADSQGTGWYQFPEAEDPFAEDEDLILARAEALEYQADLILGILRKAKRPLKVGQIFSKLDLVLSAGDMEYFGLLGAYARDALQMLLDAGKVDRVNDRIVARPVKRSVEQPYEPLLAELDGTA